jgi:hypothetical protein
MERYVGKHQKEPGHQTRDTASPVDNVRSPDPLTAHDQPIAAPAPVRAAWRTLTRHIDSTVAATHLGRAA